MTIANGVWLLGLIFGIGVSTRLFAKASSTTISCLKLVKENKKYTKLHKKNIIRVGERILLEFFKRFTIKLFFFFFCLHIGLYIIN